MADSKEEELHDFLQRSSRATRGKRMTKLVDDEIEVDEQFWNQDALREEEDDVNYEEEPEVADEFDSDFDEEEPEPDDEVENDADDRERVKKRLIFPGKPVVKKNKKKVLTTFEKISKDEKYSDVPESILPEHQEVPEDLESERTVRKSTRTSVIVRQAERDAIRAALQASIKPIKRRKEGEEKRMTQEEMLLEAAQTEIMNMRNLERVLAREEEVKKRAVVHKAVYDGPQIRYSSRNGKTYLEFSKGLSFQSQICATLIPYPDQVLCAVTAKPAKYRDPKTGLPYATKEAFKIIQERFSKEEHDAVNKENLDMGLLFGLISGQGFLSKRKRSGAVNPVSAGRTRD